MHNEIIGHSKSMRKVAVFRMIVSKCIIDKPFASRQSEPGVHRASLELSRSDNPHFTFA